MTTALKGGEGSASRSSRTLPPGKTRYPLYRRLGGPQGRSGQVRKILPSPWFDPRTVQPVASRTDCATGPTFNGFNYAKIQIAALREGVGRNYNRALYFEKHELKTGECESFVSLRLTWQPDSTGRRFQSQRMVFLGNDSSWCNRSWCTFSCFNIPQ
jgi:hypothetical protein